jgi:hypothetical protein
MSAGTPQPLSAKIELPAAFHEVIGEYRKAIGSIKKELREVEAEAKEVLKTRGVADAALQRRAEALKDIQTGLQSKLDEQTDKRHEEAKTSIREERAGLAQHFIRKTGLRSDLVEAPIGRVQETLELPGRYGKMFTQAGFTRIGGALTGIAESGGMQTAMGIVASPYLAVALAAAGAAAKLVDMRSQSVKAQSVASVAAAADFYRLSGGNPMTNQLDAGSAERAIRVRNEQLEAYTEGLHHSPRGVGDIIANAFGFHTAEQIRYASDRREHATKLEEARQRFGLTADLEINPALRRMAERTAYAERISPEFQMKRAAAYIVFGLGAEKEVRRMEEDVMTRALEKAKEQKIDGLVAGRKSEEDDFNYSAKRALDRVMANESRRWLRAVEEDRASRFNSWSLT